MFSGKGASPDLRRIRNNLLKDISSYTFGGVDPAKASFFRTGSNSPSTCVLFLRIRKILKVHIISAQLILKN